MRAYEERRLAIEELLPTTERLLAEGARFAMLVASEERGSCGGFILRHVFAHEHRYLGLVSVLESDRSGFPSLSARLPAANWAEREINDLFGLAPVGHPDPRRLVVLDDLGLGRIPPLRHDFDLASVPAAGPPRPDLPRMHGPRLFEVPVGPVHAGIIEPGHFRFTVDGEQVVQLEAQLFWTHRGLEKRSEGLWPADALRIAERLCGACSFANALAFCQAIEDACRVAVPDRALFLRVAASELERIHNHLGDLAGMLTDIAYTAGAAHLQRLREQALQLAQAFGGHRLLMGFCAIGGLQRDVPRLAAREIASDLATLLQEFRKVMAIVTRDETVHDRLEGTGVLDLTMARDHGVVGPAARASGIVLDVRRDQPYAAYGALRVPITVRSHGDVLARFEVKVAELEASVALVCDAIEQLPAGPVCSVIRGYWPHGPGLGAVEGPRGENLAMVLLDLEGRIARYHARTASYMNWPAVARSAAGNIVPDFPLINKSFNLCYACTDR